MGLDMNKLENVSEKFDGKTTARCPVCAAEGGDSKGEHLVVFPDGKFGCVKYEGDAAHRSKIQSLAGDDKGRRVHIPVRLSVRPLEVPQPCVLLSLGEFPRFSSNARRQWPPVEQSPPEPSKPPLEEDPQMKLPLMESIPHAAATTGSACKADTDEEHGGWVTSNFLNLPPRWVGTGLSTLPPNPMKDRT
jgi:hypothetical protein